MELKRINERVSVAGQIAINDLAELKAAGFTTLVNNRPDGEAPDQATDAEMRAAAEAAGLAYSFIPMGREGVSPDMVANTRKVLEESTGPVLCYCRTGTRSTTLWALSQAGEMSAADIIGAAANAGYDMSHLAGHLD